MKKFILIGLFLFGISLNINAQPSSGSTGVIRFGTADPATCKPDGRNIFYRTDLGKLKTCTATDTWTIVGGGSGAGDVSGPGTSTDNALVRFNGTDGLTIQNSGIIIDDSDNILIPSLTASRLVFSDGSKVLISSSNSASVSASISDETGSGVLVFATSPTIITPTIAKLANLTSNGFIKTSSGDGTLSIDTNTYLTANQTITLSGDISGSGTTTITTAIGNNKVNGAMIAMGSDAAGDILYYNGTDYVRLAKGSDTQVLTLASGLPSWAAASGGSGITIGTTTITSGTATRLLYETSGNVVGEISGLTSNGSTTLVQTSNSATAFESGPNGSTNPVFRLINNTSSQADGVSITGLAAGNGTTFTALSSGSNSGFNITTKGTGQIDFNANSLHTYIAGISGVGLIGFNSPVTAANSAIFGTNIVTVINAPSDYISFRIGNSEQGRVVSAGYVIGGSNDLGLFRTAAGIAEFNSGTSGQLRWYQWGGEAMVTADQTNASTTLQTSTLSVTLIASRKYLFKSILYVSDDTAAEGVKMDFGGGTASATNFRAHCTGFDTALGISTQVTSLTGTASAGTFTGNGMIECHGSFEVNGAGTFIPRFAQNSHVIGTLTLFRGSHLLVWDTP